MEAKQCICERPTEMVECLGCHFICKGRQRKECPQHPRTIFLSDLTQCLVCGSKHLLETKIIDHVNLQYLQFDSGLDDSFRTNSTG